jgi:trafficking protein particle complex subunit 12
VSALLDTHWQDYQAVINLLAPLCTHRLSPNFLPVPSPALHSALARVHLLSGNLQKAEEHFSIAASAAGNDVVMNSALLAAASGDWTLAEEALRDVVNKDMGNITVCAD